MKITLEVQDIRVDVFLEFIKTLDYVSIKEENSIQWQKNEANKRLNLIESGEMKIRNWDEAKKDIFLK